MQYRAQAIGWNGLQKKQYHAASGNSSVFPPFLCETRPEPRTNYRIAIAGENPLATEVSEWKTMDEQAGHIRPREGVRSILAIVLCAVLLRAAYHLLFLPWWSGDTVTYLDASYLLRNGFFTDGARTPAYPLFLAFARWLMRAPWSFFDPEAAVVATALQATLGVVASVMVYDTLRKLGVRPRLAFAGGLFFAELHGVCQFEMVVLAQSLSLFALILSAWLYVATLARAQRDENPLGLAVLAGLAFSFAILVRSENLVFCAALAALPIWIWLRSRFAPDLQISGRAWRTVAVTLPLAAAPLLLAWMTWNYIGIGRFQITTLSSWNINSSMYNMFGRVGPEDRVLGDLLLKADLIRNHPEKIPGEKFWLPTPPGEVIQNTYPAVLDKIILRRGEMPLPPPQRFSRFGTWVRSFASEDARQYTHSYATSVRIPRVPERQPNDIGDYVSQVSWKLVRKYPRAWLRNAGANFMREAFRFSFPPPPLGNTLEPRSFEDGSVFRNPALRPLALWLNRVEAPLMTGLFALTLGLSLFAPWILWRKIDTANTLDAMATMLAAGVIGTFVVCCLFACYAPHYGVPHWGTIVICGVYAIDRFSREQRHVA